MVGQVLVDGEIEVERARLEYYAQPPQRFAGGTANIVAEDADRAVARVVEVADQGEQRRLAGSVEAEKHGESSGRDREGNVVERPLRTVGMADRGDIESRHAVRSPACPHMLQPVGSSLFARRAGNPARGL
jgi:hypothetical protein